MIILFEENEREFNTLGIGVLKDATECSVKEGLNDVFELEMLYDVSGSLYKELKHNRIIYTKPNPFTEPQPFRIDDITKPINGVVTVTAKHISYDTNAIPVKPIGDEKEGMQYGKDINTTLLALTDPNHLYVDHPFKFSTNFSLGREFKTTSIYNLRSILMGDDEESILGVYKAEIEFDKFEIKILSRRGKDRGAKICYGLNMTDLKHETTTERLYNGVLPFYHKETEETETATTEEFKKAYIVGTRPFVDGWLSFTEGGAPYHPLDSTPVQIDTEGEYKDRVYSWNTTYQRYDEKLYNQTVILLQNALTPEWVRIDWSTFPRIKIVANRVGYYKLSTETEWGDKKGPGDVIFEGNIAQEGISGLATNMLLFFAEVIPSEASSTKEEVSNVHHVELDDPIIWINTVDAKTMTHNKILLLDLTSEFDKDPDQDQLREKANTYISKNFIGSLYHTTSVSFVDLNEDIYQNFSHIELGDTVKIIYEEIGLETELRVISTNYNAITDTYNSVDLGNKEDTLSKSSIQNGDKISSLTNDSDYASTSIVNKLIADTVTANFINAVNAKLSKAQIEELQVAKISVPGIIEASQYVIDDLVAKMLTAENAKIAKELEAGRIKVNGNITINGGAINIKDDENNTYFTVDKRGNVVANSVEITGGTFNINDGAFAVDNKGNVSITQGWIKIGEVFEVTNKGNMVARSANLLEGCTIAGMDVTANSLNLLVSESSQTEDPIPVTTSIEISAARMSSSKVSLPGREYVDSEAGSTVMNSYSEFKDTSVYDFMLLPSANTSKRSEDDILIVNETSYTPIVNKHGMYVLLNKIKINSQTNERLADESYTSCRIAPEMFPGIPVMMNNMVGHANYVSGAKDPNSKYPISTMPAVKMYAGNAQISANGTYEIARGIYNNYDFFEKGTLSSAREVLSVTATNSDLSSAAPTVSWDSEGTITIKNTDAQSAHKISYLIIFR